MKLNEWTTVLQSMQSADSQSLREWWSGTVLSQYLEACREACEAGDKDALTYWASLPSWTSSNMLVDSEEQELAIWQTSWIHIIAWTALRLIAEGRNRTDPFSPKSAEAESFFVQAIREQAQKEFTSPEGTRKQEHRIREGLLRSIEQMRDGFYQDLAAQLRFKPVTREVPGQFKNRISYFPLTKEQKVTAAHFIAETTDLPGWDVFPDPAEILFYCMREDFLTIYRDVVALGQWYREFRELPTKTAVRIKLFAGSAQREPIYVGGRSAAGAQLRALMKVWGRLDDADWYIFVSVDLPDTTAAPDDYSALEVRGVDVKSQILNASERHILVLSTRENPGSINWIAVYGEIGGRIVDIESVLQLESPYANLSDYLQFLPETPKSPPRYFGWRDEEYTHAKAALADKCRLMMLHGPRGTGKSTLWHKIARDLQQATLLGNQYRAVLQLDLQKVSLTDETDPNYWLAALREQMTKIKRAALSSDISPADETMPELLERIKLYLEGRRKARKRILLVIDNFEEALGKEENAIQDNLLKQFLAMVSRVEYHWDTLLINKIAPPIPGLPGCRNIGLLPLRESDAIAMLRSMDADLGKRLEELPDEHLSPLVRKAGYNPRVMFSYANRLHDQSGNIQDLLNEPMFVGPSEVDQFIFSHYASLNTTQRRLALVIAALRQEQTVNTVLDTMQAAFPQNEADAEHELHRMTVSYFLDFHKSLMSLNAHYLDVITGMLNGEEGVPNRLRASREHRQAIYRAAAGQYKQKLSGYTREEYDRSVVEWYFRYEDEAFITCASEWLRCLSFLDPQEAEKQFFYLWLDAFDWGSIAAPWDVPHRFLEVWRRTSVHRVEVEAKRSLGEKTLYDMLYDFDTKEFPREPERPDILLTYPHTFTQEENEAIINRWRQVEVTLKTIQARLGIDDEDRPEDSTLNHLLSNLFYYRAHAVAGMQEPARHAEAEYLIEQCIEMGKKDEHILSLLGYSYADLAVFHCALGHWQKTWKTLHAGYASIEGNDAARTDIEVKSRILLIVGDLLWQEGNQEEAMLCWQWTLHYEYIYLFWDQSMFADDYSRAVYKMWGEKLTGRLLMLAAHDMEEALRYSHSIHDFFAVGLHDDPAEARLDDTQLRQMLLLPLGKRPSFFGILFPDLPAEDLWNKPASWEMRKRSPQIPPLARKLKKSKAQKAQKYWDTLAALLAQKVGEREGDANE